MKRRLSPSIITNWSLGHAIFATSCLQLSRVDPRSTEWEKYFKDHWQFSMASRTGKYFTPAKICFSFINTFHFSQNLCSLKKIYFTFQNILFKFKTVISLFKKILHFTHFTFHKKFISLFTKIHSTFYKNSFHFSQKFIPLFTKIHFTFYKYSFHFLQISISLLIKVHFTFNKNSFLFSPMAFYRNSRSIENFISRKKKSISLLKSISLFYFSISLLARADQASCTCVHAIRPASARTRRAAWPNIVNICLKLVINLLRELQAFINLIGMWLKA